MRIKWCVCVCVVEKSVFLFLRLGRGDPSVRYITAPLPLPVRFIFQVFLSLSRQLLPCVFFCQPSEEPMPTSTQAFALLSF